MIPLRLPSNQELYDKIESWKTIEDTLKELDNNSLAERQLLLELHQESKEQLGIEFVEGHEYRYDLAFGLKMYERLKISPRTASDNRYWIHKGVYVVPDIVFWRWGPRAHDRYYKISSRIWLKVIWWYIHLSWQDSTEETFRILEMNSTDTIVQLVERSGTQGYRLKLCRVLMRHYHQYCMKSGKSEAEFFRRLMKLNTARLAAIEPALCEGEEEGYVRKLFADLEDRHRNTPAGN